MRKPVARPQVLRTGNLDPKDQFFTRAEDAERSWEFLHDEADIPANARYVDPCVGGGAFYRLMPVQRRQGFDIEIQPGMERHKNIVCHDFLKLDPLTAGLPPGFVAVSNPPFGFRGSLAIAFVNKCFELGASYVGFVVPTLMVPDWEGPPISERRYQQCRSIAHWGPIDYFDLPNGKTHKVNKCGFVVFARGRRKDAEPGPTCDTWFNIHSISNYPHHSLRRRGPMDRCDWFVRASRFKTEKKPVFVKKLDRQGRWLGIELLRPGALKVLKSLDWDKLGREGAMRNICICARHIRTACIEAGLVDEPGAVKALKPGRKARKRGAEPFELTSGAS